MAFSTFQNQPPSPRTEFGSPAQSEAGNHGNRTLILAGQLIAKALLRFSSARTAVLRRLNVTGSLDTD